VQAGVCNRKAHRISKSTKSLNTSKGTSSLVSDGLQAEQSGRLGDLGKLRRGQEVGLQSGVHHNTEQLQSVLPLEIGFGGV
jgi:hypothetical protein